ncbi:hypothetical protein [Hyphomicrobium sp. ghe19]|uniref:hypothetical protein n=1 Tax=Hyphomicrobium sp. ghe19 TaxID=2682968 RepID=UPI0030CCB489
MDLVRSGLAWLAVCFACPASADDGPSMIGTWSGKNFTIGDIHGLRVRDRTVHITEQTDRRFRGYFVYEAGRKDFFGVVFPDNASFGWVSPTSKGYVQGHILSADHISACYLEPGAEATAGCSDLTRTSAKP